METQVLFPIEVTVNVYGNKKVRRIAIGHAGDVVLVCKNEEFEAAKLENRPPITVGIKQADVEGLHDAKTG